MKTTLGRENCPATTQDSYPCLALYGANASGKSNVLSGLGFFSDAVTWSHRLWEPDGGVPRTPFAWGGSAEPSLYEAIFLEEGCRYRYGFTVDDQRVLEEWLYAYPNGRRQIWFERENENYKFGENLKGENRLIEEITGENALYLSAASQHRHKQLFPIYSWFRSIQTFNLPFDRRRRRYARRRSNIHRILQKRADDEIKEQEQEELARFVRLLRVSDFGVRDVRLQQSESTDGFVSSRYLLEHDVDRDDAWLPLEEESSGTQTMFHIATPVLETLQHGGLMVVDELESSLHPLLAMELVKLFNEPSSNPKNAQIVFTTHDAALLGTTIGEPVLRRDQVFLTEKGSTGSSVVYPLTDYKPRKAENLERGYLQGRYGGIPFLGAFSDVGTEK